MKPTADQFKGWVDGSVRHPFYAKSVEYYNDLKVHAYGEYPKDLIKGARPSEGEHIQIYREKIFQSATQGVMDKVFNSTTKIRKASDYTIDFSRIEERSDIAKEETLANYCQYEFPKYDSVDNWFWATTHKQALIDSNAFVLVSPLAAVKSNEYVKPYAMVFNSPHVYDYVSNEWCFLEVGEPTTYIQDGRGYEGKAFIYADKDVIVTYTQKSNNEYSVVEQVNIVGKVPIVRLKAVVEKETSKHTLYRSRIHSMLPHLKEATREYSDLQISVVQSMFPTYWFMGAPKCEACGGMGKIPKKDGAAGESKCKACGGKGEFPFNPAEHIRINVKPSTIGGVNPVIPPGGIIEKDTKVIEIQDKRIDNHLYKALKAVNMEHLDSTPLNQSGTAKEWDRSEGNNFVSAIAEDFIFVIDSTIELINDWRYSVIIPDQKKRDAMLPIINVPVKFDIATDSAIAEEIRRMKDGKMSPVLIVASEVEFAARLFNGNPDVKDKVKLMYDLDPLAGKASDDILSETMQGWISKESGVIHANIKAFIERAMFENKDFASSDQNIQKETMVKYAKEFIISNSTTARVIDMTAQNPTSAAANA